VPSRTKLVKISVAILSLLLSFVFWLILTSSETGIQDMPVPLNVTLPGEDLFVTDTVFPKEVIIRVEAKLPTFQEIARRRLQLRIDLSAETESGEYVFDLETVAAELSLPWGATITQIPDPIPYVLYGYSTKTVDVSYSQSGSMDPRLDIHGPVEITPRQAVIRGPVNVLENINSLEFEVRRDRFVPGEHIPITPKTPGHRVTVTPPVSFTVYCDVSWKRENITLEDVPVSLADPSKAPPGHVVSMEPATVDMLVSWPVNIDLPTPPSYGARALVDPDLSRLSAGRGRQVRVSDKQISADIQTIRISPTQVYVSLRRIPEEAPPAPAPTPPAAGEGVEGEAPDGDDPDGAGGGGTPGGSGEGGQPGEPDGPAGNG
jgi:hypothetical protein